MVRLLEEYQPVDETHGILSLSDIKSLCGEVFRKHAVDYAYLFGSYAKGKATEKSDVDLLVSTKATGLRFFGLVEELKNALHKNVDVLDLNQLNNKDLINEILKDGIKIF
ncbi:MAG: nucleotidyltransferase domain-containing protein [Parasporobacterium sp.]|nr:nucleotidyltransferase domain-containing protein [Parasporobacterium sp.]